MCIRTFVLVYQAPLHLGDYAQAVAGLYLCHTHTGGPGAHHLPSTANLYPTDFTRLRVRASGTVLVRATLCSTAVRPYYL
eukprot:SAG11_NODE_8341_length_1025_cov_2.750809_2_plen_79_part_01